MADGALILLNPFPHQEDPRRRIIIAPYVFWVRFTCKGFYLSLATSSPARFSPWPDEVMSLALGSS